MVSDAATTQEGFVVAASTSDSSVREQVNEAIGGTRVPETRHLRHGAAKGTRI